MNRIEICERLDREFKVFMSMFPMEVRPLIWENAYFAGGCIRSLAIGEEPNDFDVFLRRMTSDNFWRNVIEWDRTSAYALTKGKFQLVTRYCGEPTENVVEFDFKHNMLWYEPPTSHLDERYCTLEQCRRENLIFNRMRPREIERVYTRIPKFIERGMTIDEREEMEILDRCNLGSIVVGEYRFREKDENGNYGGGEQ